MRIGVTLTPSWILSLRVKLFKIVFPVDVHCKNPNHIAEIDEYALNILGAMDDIVKQIAEKNDEMSKKSKGWNDLVKPFKEDMMFWHSIWISTGKPLNNTLHHIMKRTRNIYHYPWAYLALFFRYIIQTQALATPDHFPKGMGCTESPINKHFSTETGEGEGSRSPNRKACRIKYNITWPKTK